METCMLLAGVRVHDELVTPVTAIRGFLNNLQFATFEVVSNVYYTTFKYCKNLPTLCTVQKKSTYGLFTKHKFVNKSIALENILSIFSLAVMTAKSSCNTGHRELPKIHEKATPLLVIKIITLSSRTIQLFNDYYPQGTVWR